MLANLPMGILNDSFLTIMDGQEVVENTMECLQIFHATMGSSIK
jgi:hypothetical protein